MTSYRPVAAVGPERCRKRGAHALRAPVVWVAVRFRGARHHGVPRRGLPVAAGPGRHQATTRTRRRSASDRRPGRFPAVRLSHLEADELPNSADPWGIGSQRRGKGDVQPAAGGLRPYDPSFEMPAEGGPNERLTGASIPRRVTRPAEYSWPCLSRRSRLSSSRGSFALRSVPRVTSAPIFANPSQLSGCPNGSISRWPATRGAAQASDAP
jgi:hypothetical protein